MFPVCVPPVRGTAPLFVLCTLWLQGLVFGDLDLLSSTAAGRAPGVRRRQIRLFVVLLGHRVRAATATVDLAHWARPQSVHLEGHRLWH